MDALKSLFIVLLFTINSLCLAIKIECSICHELFDRGKTGTICPNCKELIAAVKEWKKGCSECRKYMWLDLCPDCLINIKQEKICNERHHSLYHVCVNCLKESCKDQMKYGKYDGEETPNCFIKECKNPISSKGCCGYPTGLCNDHNEALRKIIKEHKFKCAAGCKTYPLLDLCPECLNLINIQKVNHKECIWKDTPYDIYVPCTTCLSCYESLIETIRTHKFNCKAGCNDQPTLKLCPECLGLINEQKAGHTDCMWKDTPYDVYVPCATCLACYACE